MYTKEEAIAEVQRLFTQWYIYCDRDIATTLVEIGMKVTAAAIPPADLRVVEPDWGDLMTVEEFCQNVKSGFFIQNDGSGYWSTATGYSWDHNVWSTSKPLWATHVMWFNK